MQYKSTLKNQKPKLHSEASFTPALNNVVDAFVD